jgi:hypothetical protein
MRDRLGWSVVCDIQMPKTEEEAFNLLMEKDAGRRKRELEETVKRLKAADEYEVIKLY